jgi:hypothetical protein
MVERPRVFLSYSTKDKVLARQIKIHISRKGYSVFLAHEDLKISQEWISEIRKELRLCDVYVALLTENFRKSEWTDQEAGYALSRSKRKEKKCVILPITVHPIKSPHGFLKAFQALRLKTDDIEGTCHLAARELDDKLGLKEQHQDQLIEKFLQSGSFQLAKRNFRELTEHQPFSAEQMERIMTAALENNQTQLPELLSPMRDLVAANRSVSKTKKEQFIEQFRRLTAW